MKLLLHSILPLTAVTLLTGCATRFGAPELPIHLDSKPTGATVYIVPSGAWEMAGGPAALEKGVFLETYFKGTTPFDTMIPDYPQIYVAEWKANDLTNRQFRVIDPRPNQENVFTLSTPP